MAPIAGIDRLDAVGRFERAHPDARFVGWVTELEYWRECGAARRGRRPCFEQLDTLLSAMERARATRDDPPWLGVYVGYPTREEAAELGRRADRVLLNYHGRDPVHAFGRRAGRHSIARRLSYFAGARAQLWPILYARGEVHMGRWLRTHDLDAAEHGLVDTLRAHPVQDARFGGLALFDYRALDRIERE